MLLILSSALAFNGVRLVVGILRGKLTALGDFQLPIVLGSVAMIYLSISSIVRIIY
ncbi:MAG: hypothetical protein AABM67_03675 [Acidobacteriota bacterium]